MADQNNEERAPLLQNPAGHDAGGLHSYSPLSNSDTTSQTVVTVPPIGPEELPPPYTPSSQGGVPLINCKVCQSLINIEGKTHQHVVKCNVCNEATPIKPPPKDKKYVRCPCNCLLICKDSSQRIACPRPNCKKIINLGAAASAVLARPPGTNRVICAHCHEAFLFNTMNVALARCPHCRNVSSVGRKYARNRAIMFTIVGILIIGAGVGVSVGTAELAKTSGGIYVVWVGAFILGILLLLRACYYACMKISKVDGPM